MTRLEDILRDGDGDPMAQMLEALAAERARRQLSAETVSIVCEGACNPHLAEYTEQARRFAQSRAVAPVPESSLLTHTRHVQVSGEWYRCTVCGTRRKF